jgi:hypothetical protein
MLRLSGYYLSFLFGHYHRQLLFRRPCASWEFHVFAQFLEANGRTISCSVQCSSVYSVPSNPLQVQENYWISKYLLQHIYIYIHTHTHTDAYA